MSDDKKISKKSKQKIMLGVTLLVVAIVILSSVIIYIQSIEEEKEPAKKELPDEVDDRISPLTTQTVNLEVSRIRKKGIEEQMRKIGSSWKNTPNYYFQATMHDGLWTFRTIDKWDTDYVGWEAFRIVPEEMETCKIEFKIFEPQKKLFKTVDVEQDCFNIVYDFRTGRWAGDDSFNDSDGYGYYNGENFEIWFDVHQADYDGDGIPYWTEVNVLKTDPKFDDRLSDPDNDNVSTAWEWKWGYDPMSFNDHSTLDPDMDGIPNQAEFDLRKYLANPYRKDIFVEVDYMEKEPGLFGYEHVFWEESQQMVMDKFSEQNIVLHIDDGCMGGGGEYVDFIAEYISQEGGVASDYYKNHFSDDRKGIFRYGIIVHSAGWAHPQTYKLAYDVISVPCNKDFYKSVFEPFGIPKTERQQRIAMAVGFMHELGHTLSLRWETNHGIDNGTQIGRGLEDVPLLQRLPMQKEAKQAWNNYESCMNYHKFGQFVLGYSDGTHGTNDVDDWSMIDFYYFKTHEPNGVEGIEDVVEV